MAPVIRLLLLTSVFTWAGVAAEGPEPHKFGEKVALSWGASLSVARLDAAALRSRYSSEFPADRALAAFELRWGKDGIYVFGTDREDPSRSDIVVLCGTGRINILKAGGGTFDRPKQYHFGLPGGFQIDDGRWISVAAGGAVPLVMVFELPDGCSPLQAQLSAKITVREAGGKSDERSHELLFADEGPRKKP